MMKNCFDVMRPAISTILPVILNNITIKFPSVTNNAIWVLGELSLQLSKNFYINFI